MDIVYLLSSEGKAMGVKCSKCNHGNPEDTLAAFSQETYLSPFFISYVYAFAGEKEEALEWLERAYEIKDPNMPYIGAKGIHDSVLHNEPHFHDLRRRMNLPGEIVSKTK
jgi:hypothetical protein